MNFTGVKAGTYVIRAYADKEYIGNGNIPSFEAEVVVLFDLSDKKLLMNVGDTYDIIENSNIPNANQFRYSSTNGNVAFVDGKGIITAKNSSPQTEAVAGMAIGPQMTAAVQAEPDAPCAPALPVHALSTAVLT